MNSDLKFNFTRLGGPVAQLLVKQAIDREVESSNQASDSEKCHRVAKGQGPLLANSTSSTEMRHPPALSLSTLTLVGMSKYFHFRLIVD